MFANHRSNSEAMVRWVFIWFCAALWIVGSYVPGLAHKVMIFAWVDGDTVYTQSKLGGGKKVKGAQVLVFDAEGNQLLEGKTDDNGEFSFKVPKKADLKIVLNASMGHRAEWMIRAEEIKETGQFSKGLQAGTGTSGQAVASLGKKEIKDLIDESLDRKLVPIIKMLAESLDHGPRITEVIGGIGYIFGLVGVALYFARRPRNDGNER